VKVPESTTSIFYFLLPTTIVLIAPLYPVLADSEYAKVIYVKKYSLDTIVQGLIRKPFLVVDYDSDGANELLVLTTASSPLTFVDGLIVVVNSSSIERVFLENIYL